MEHQTDHFDIDGTTVSVAEIDFLEILKESDSIATWRVAIRDKQYVMKVYHTYQDEVELNFSLYRNEYAAYRRLQSHGLCDKGFIPQFYGSIDSLNPKIHSHSLSHFVPDELRPSAIFLEYIPDIHELNTNTYTKERWQTILDILRLIHKAGVLHEDASCQNAMVCPGTGRVLWIDFDRARTFDHEGMSLDSVEMQLMEIEFEFATGTGEDLQDGQAQGLRP